MKTLDKLEILAKRKKKGKGNARGAMLRVVMPLLSGERGDKLTKAVNSGNVDDAKHIWNSAGDDLYQAVEMIRDKLSKTDKGKSNANQSKA